MFTSAKPARGSAAATATAQVEWSASVMRDTMVGYKQHIIFKLLDTLIFFFSFVLFRRKVLSTIEFALILHTMSTPASTDL